MHMRIVKLVSALHRNAGSTDGVFNGMNMIGIASEGREPDQSTEEINVTTFNLTYS